MKLYQYWELSNREKWSQIEVTLTHKENTRLYYLKTFIVTTLIRLRFFKSIHKEFKMFHSISKKTILVCDNSDICVDLVGFVTKHFPWLRLEVEENPCRLMYEDDVLSFHDQAYSIVKDVRYGNNYLPTIYYIHDGRTKATLGCLSCEDRIEELEPYIADDLPRYRFRNYDIYGDITYMSELLHNHTNSGRLVSVTFNANLTPSEAIKVLEAML